METKKYELSFWLTSNLNESEAEAVFNEIAKKIESWGGQIINTQIPQLKPLSYKIKKETNGYFGFVQFSGSENKLSDLEKEIRLNDKILRFIIIGIRDIKQRARPRERKHSFLFKSRQISSQEQATASSNQSKPVSDSREEMSLEELDEKLNEILKEE